MNIQFFRGLVRGLVRFGTIVAMGLATAAAHADVRAAAIAAMTICFCISGSTYNLPA